MSLRTHQAAVFQSGCIIFLSCQQSMRVPIRILTDTGPFASFLLRLEYFCGLRGRREGRVSSPVFTLRLDSSLEYPFGDHWDQERPCWEHPGSPSDGVDISGCPAHALDVHAVGLALKEMQSHVNHFRGKVATAAASGQQRGPTVT